MEWRDEGVLLSARPHGETSVIAEVFTRGHGRHAGVVRGGASRKAAAHLQPGAQVAVTWRARLEDQLGSFVLEPLRARAGVLGDAGRLAALTSACALLRLALPERDPHGGLWQATIALFDALEVGEGAWAGRYIRWELGLLDDIGFGLDLTRCAVTGGASGWSMSARVPGARSAWRGRGTGPTGCCPCPNACAGARRGWGRGWR